MVSEVQKAGHTPAASKYVPTTITSPGEKPIVISFKKGSELAVDAKEYPINKPSTVKLDKAHYKALLNMDANHDKKVDAEDAKLIQKSKHKDSIYANPHTGITNNMSSNKANAAFKRVSVFLPGAIDYNRAHPEEE